MNPHYLLHLWSCHNKCQLLHYNLTIRIHTIHRRRRRLILHLQMKIKINTMMINFYMNAAYASKIEQ